MLHSFYNVRARQKETLLVTNRVVYFIPGKPSGSRYAFSAKTSTDDNVTAFVKQSVFDSCDAPVVRRESKLKQKKKA
jgi:hypothetical protein